MGLKEALIVRKGEKFRGYEVVEVKELFRTREITVEKGNKKIRYSVDRKPGGFLRVLGGYMDRRDRDND